MPDAAMRSLPPRSGSFITGCLRRRALALLGAVGLLLSACSTNPATGERQFTGFLPASQEKQLGAQEHPRILAEFGGPYRNAQVQAYAERLGRTLAQHAGTPDTTYTITVLDSDVVNAFALPGGYVYITRGLMALTNNEAQLAGVVGHEIGHIAARHTAERYSRGTLAQLGAVVAGVFGGQQLGQVAAAGAQLALAGWSRGQELEADQLGLDYMASAGYDPLEVAAFLDIMGAEARLQAALAGDPGAADSFNYLQTHPPTGDRVERAMAAARNHPGVEMRLARDEYMRVIDGMVYGDSPENGFVRGRSFIHPTLGFRFEVPTGFRLLNGQRQVTAVGPDKQAVITFDAAPAQGVQDPAAFIARVWAAQAGVTNLERIEVNGMPAATGTTLARTSGGGQALVRFVAIRLDPDTFYRFLFVSAPQLGERLSVPFRETTYSFRRLSEEDRRSLRPYRLRVVEVRPGDTVASLARRMPFDEMPEQRFRVLNNLRDDEQLRPGTLVKLVTSD